MEKKGEEKKTMGELEARIARLERALELCLPGHVAELARDVAIIKAKAEMLRAPECADGHAVLVDPTPKFFWTTFQSRGREVTIGDEYGVKRQAADAYFKFLADHKVGIAAFYKQLLGAPIRRYDYDENAKATWPGENGRNGAYSRRALDHIHSISIGSQTKVSFCKHTGCAIGRSNGTTQIVIDHINCNYWNDANETSSYHVLYRGQWVPLSTLIHTDDNDVARVASMTRLLQDTGA